MKLLNFLMLLVVRVVFCLSFSHLATIKSHQSVPKLHDPTPPNQRAPATSFFFYKQSTSHKALKPNQKYSNLYVSLFPHQKKTICSINRIKSQPTSLELQTSLTNLLSTLSSDFLQNHYIQDNFNNLRSLTRVLLEGTPKPLTFHDIIFNDSPHGPVFIIYSYMALPSTSNPVSSFFVSFSKF